MLAIGNTRILVATTAFGSQINQSVVSLFNCINKQYHDLKEKHVAKEHSILFSKQHSEV